MTKAITFTDDGMPDVDTDDGGTWAPVDGSFAGRVEREILRVRLRDGTVLRGALMLPSCGG